ncbi:MAG: hypothetical protein J6C92_15470, partial [Bacteroidaceae bacterium]|nr:hypothetical protein [Bacteroidaceae bacterium]
TNTPGLGAAQQAYFDTTGNTATDMAQGYAVAYPLGVIGCILSFVLIRMMLYRISGVHSNIASHNKVETKGSVQNNPDQPNLIPIFIGIALGCILGSIPISFPGIPQPVKLGLAGGPLIVSILISRFGPKFHIITYTTPSANLMIREIGISLFLACVGLEAGEGFIDTLVHGDGMKWILYGALITAVPVLTGGFIGKYVLKLDYNTLTGVLSGACTNPPALAYASEQDRDSDKTGVSYATVYPLSMFLRVLAAQLMVLFFS